MTTGKPSRCRWTALPASLGAALSALITVLPTPARGAPLAVVLSSAAIPDQLLHLEVTLNRVPQARILPFAWRQGRLWAEVGTLRELGLKWPAWESASGLLALEDLPGMQVDYDSARQRLRLLVPVAMLEGPTHLLGYTDPAAPQLDADSRAPGLLLNYELYAQGSSASRNLSSWNELRAFGLGAGVLSSSSLLQWGGGSQQNSYFHGTRLDSAWRLDFPEALSSLSVGDAFSGALPWTRSMRYGGLRLARNFGLQPYRVTVPLAAFAGEATLPSVVDLYINGIRESQSQVQPGQFQVMGAPVLNGVGQAQVVITDITGQRRVLDFALYNSARLLQQGLADWSLDLGRLRRQYGVHSFSYAPDWMGSGSLRYGLSNQLTLEAQGQATAGLVMGGGGASLLLGQAGGVLSAAGALSQYANSQGRQHGLGYEWRGGGMSLTLSTLRRNAAFKDVASLEGSALPARIDQGFVGLSLWRGQLGASYVKQEQAGGSRFSHAGLSWSQSLGGYGHLSLGLSRDLEGLGGTTAHFYWSMPLGLSWGRQAHGWVRGSQQQSGSAFEAGAMRSISGDRDDWGWRVQAGHGRDTSAQAELSQLNRFGQWRLGTQYWQGDSGHGSSSQASASGGLLWMEGGFFPLRRVHDAFALVSTEGIADVPVLLENRPVGRTDERGLLLVTPLNAWENNELAIDPLALPADVSVQGTRQTAVPSTGAAVLVRFPLQRSRVVELALREAGGDWVAAGSAVRLMPGEQQATVGYDGRVYLNNPAPGAWLTVQREAGACQLRLPAKLPERGRIDLGALICQ